MEATSENGSRPAAELQDPDALSECQENEYDDTFVHTCEELDPFDDNFEEDAQKLIDQFDEARNAADRLMEMVGTGMRICLFKRRDQLFDMDDELSKSKKQCQDLEARVAELESAAQQDSAAARARIAELESAAEQGSNDQRIQELEAELDISKGECSLLEKKLALASRKDSPATGSMVNLELLVAQNQQMQYGYMHANAEVQRLTQENAALQQALCNAQSVVQPNVQALYSENARLRHEVQVARRHRFSGNLPNRLDTVEAEKAALQKHLDEATADLQKQLHEVKADLQKQLADARADYFTAMGENEALREEMRALASREPEETWEDRAELATAKADLADAKLEANTTKFYLTDAKADLESAKKELADEKQALAAAKAKLAAAETKLDATEIELTESRRQCTLKDATIRGLQARDDKDSLRQKEEEVAAILKDSLRQKEEEVAAILKDAEDSAAKCRADSQEQLRALAAKAEKEKERAVAEVRRQFEEDRNFSRVRELKQQLDHATEQAELHKKRRDEAVADARAARLQQRAQEDELFKSTKLLNEQDAKLAAMEAQVYEAQSRLKEQAARPCQAEESAKPDAKKAADDAFKAEKAALHARICKAEQADAEKAKKIKALRDDIEMLESQLRNAKKECKDYPQKVQQLNSAVDDLKKQILGQQALAKQIEDLQAENSRLNFSLATSSKDEDKDRKIKSLEEQIEVMEMDLRAHEMCIESHKVKEVVYMAQSYAAGSCLLSAFRGQQVMSAMVFAALQKEFPEPFAAIHGSLRGNTELQARFMGHVMGPRRDSAQHLSTYHRVMKIMDLINTKGCLKWDSAPAEIMSDTLDTHTRIVAEVMVNHSMSSFPTMDSILKASESVKMQLFYFAAKVKDKTAAADENLRGKMQAAKRATDQILQFETNATKACSELKGMTDTFDGVHETLENFTPEDFHEVDQMLDSNFKDGYQFLADKLAAKAKGKGKSLKLFEDLDKQNLLTTFSGKPILPSRSRASLKMVMVDPANAAAVLSEIEKRDGAKADGEDSAAGA